MFYSFLLMYLSPLTFFFNPYQPKIITIDGLNNIEYLKKEDIVLLKEKFDNFPILIFKNISNISPHNLFPFLSIFDNQSYDIQYHYKTMDISSNYIWKNDILKSGIASIYVLKEPLIGGSFEFISTEKIYNELNKYEKIAANNLLINYDNFNLPLVYQTTSKKLNILLFPSLFKKVSGWNSKDSSKWMNYFMYDKVLPHRSVIQLKKKDLCIFNTNSFLYSETPYSKYISDRGFFLYSSLISNNKLFGLKSENREDIYTNINAAYNTNWISSKINSHKSFYEIKNFYVNGPKLLLRD